MTADDAFGNLLDKEQLLGGGAPTRRAGTLLFLIQARTARLVDRSRRRLERVLTDEAAQERALAFVEAFALARDATVEVTVHDLERQAQHWASLVPRNPRLQAALARRLAEKYRFTAAVAPGIVRALGLDDPAVGDAYRALYGEEIGSLDAVSLTLRERLRWTWTRLAKRLENLPPFWSAYALTLTETVGASILALPIALATLGPLAGVAILAILGLVNILTVWMMSEAVVRTGPMRYGNAFLGRLVDSCLGGRVALPVSLLLAVLAFIGIPTYSIGVGRTLEGVTSVPAAVWVSLLFAISVWIVRRGSLDATVAIALAIGAVNLVLILGLSGLALAHVDATNLLHSEVPFVDGRPFDASVVAVVFGVVLMAFFGHLSAVTCSSLVLERDPSGRSLIGGCVAAQVTALALYCLFVVVTIGAVGASGLQGLDGTVVDPLADVAGASAAILGSAFVILALGLGPIIDSLTLFWLTQERLPSTARRVIVLPRRRGRLLFRGRGLRGGIAYLGDSLFAVDLERQGRLEQFEVEGRGAVDALPSEDAARHRLTLNVLEADDLRARVAVTSTLRLGYEGELDVPGLDLAEVLSLSADEAAVVAAVARLGEADAATVAEDLGRGERETIATMERLVAHGVVRERRTPTARLFSARMARRRGSRSAVWEALADESRDGRQVEPQAADWQPRRLGRRGRAALCLAPTVAAFAVAEWLALTGIGSFAGLLSLLGVIVVSLLAGLLPVLLIASSRRNGEYVPGWSSRVIGRPVVLGAIYALFVGALFAHGLVIWSNPFERACALAAGVAMLTVPVLLAGSGRFRHRQTIEVRDDQRAGDAGIALLSPEGRRPLAGVGLEYVDGREQEAASGEIASFDSLRRAVVTLQGSESEDREDVKIWAHRVTPEGESEALTATAVFRSDRLFDPVDLSLSRGEAVFPLAGSEVEVEILLREA